MTADPEFYKALGVSPRATGKQIKRAYFAAARRLHPDANPDPDANEHFLAVQKAYEVLLDPKKRAAYDAEFQSVNEPFNYQLTFSSPTLFRLEEPQVVYVLLDLTVKSTQPSGPKSSLNICLVIDRSTSMKGARMDTVKAGAIQFVKRLARRDYFSVVAFSDRAELVIPAAPAAQLGKLIDRISLLNTFGGTEIYYGLAAGLAQLQKPMSKRTVNHLILITDGHTYGDEEKCLELARRAADEGIVISALGIGSEWNDDFLDRLAGLSGGRSVFISAEQNLNDFIDGYIQTLGIVDARQVQLRLDLSPGVTLRYGFRIAPEVSPLLGENSFRVGNLSSGCPQTVLLELMINSIPPAQTDYKLAEIRLSGQLQNDGVVREMMVSISQPIGTETVVVEPPKRIVEVLSRLRYYRLHEKARLELEQGNTEQATRRLKNLATHLIAQGERELAQIVLLEAERVREERQFSRDGDKRIKYGTRGLLLPSGFEEELA
ncbi:MAG: VWA domain-containing protein [Anaerolineaceae bacterium]|nr:VWA domain-containing protein [Anaerolineaceae bacterium]